MIWRMRDAKTYLFVAALALMCIAGESSAHVKWFTEFDNAKPPLPISDVLTKTFIGFFIALAVLQFAANPCLRLTRRAKLVCSAAVG